MHRNAAILGVIAGLSLAASAAADPVRVAAESTAACRGLEEADARLACFDAASLALATALSGAEPPASAPAPEAAPERLELAEAPVVQQAASEPAPVIAPDRPEWADAPEVQPAASTPSREREPDRFEAVIVRITVNNAGRHTFYTEDGDVWEQTLIEEIRPPKSLPAIAEFRRRLTGNPTIKFDVSNRAYRVRRVE